MRNIEGHETNHPLHRQHLTLRQVLFETITMWLIEFASPQGHLLPTLEKESERRPSCETTDKCEELRKT